MKRSVVETLLGAVVIAVAIVFLMFSYRIADVGAVGDGYEVVAHFSGIGGLQAGDEVQISGVKVGNVSRVELDPDTYLARVYIKVNRTVKLPVDTAALISSESLLGGRYLSLEPGADEEVLADGGVIEYTQAPQNLEQLLGQFIFSVSDEGAQNNSEGGASQ